MACIVAIALVSPFRRAFIEQGADKRICFGFLDSDRCHAHSLARVCLQQGLKIVLTEFGARLARNGNMILPENILNIYGLPASKGKIDPDCEHLFRLFSPDGELLALAKTQPNKSGLHPFLVIDTGIIQNRDKTQK